MNAEPLPGHPLTCPPECPRCKQIMEEMSKLIKEVVK